MGRHEKRSIYKDIQANSDLWWYSCNFTFLRCTQKFKNILVSIISLKTLAWWYIVYNITQLYLNFVKFDQIKLIIGLILKLISSVFCWSELDLFSLSLVQAFIKLNPSLRCPTHLQSYICSSHLLLYLCSTKEMVALKGVIGERSMKNNSKFMSCCYYPWNKFF